MNSEKCWLWDYCKVSRGVCAQVNGDCDVCCSIEKEAAIRKIEKERKDKKMKGDKT